MSIIGWIKKLKQVGCAIMGKRFNPNLAKIHRSYTVEECALLFGVHKNTVRAWIKQGLPLNDDKRPILILGSELRGFLQAKRSKNKKKCQPCEIYCVRCKSQQRLVDGLVEYEVVNNATGRIIAICPTCGCIVNKYANLRGLALIQEQLGVTIPRILKQLN
jgi:hypothetical protein